MIIWIDGTYGVGKTAVALKIKEAFSDGETEFLESDWYSQEALKKMVEEAKKNNCFPVIGGTLPQNNVKFIEEFKKVIEEKSKDTNKKIIVDMSLTRRECKEGLFDCLADTSRNIIHIILIANKETIKERIMNDSSRDKQLALDMLNENISFLNSNFDDAIRIETDNRSVSDIANEIIKIIRSFEAIKGN